MERFFMATAITYKCRCNFANAIGTDQLEISTSSGSSRIFMDGANNRIEIFDSSAVNPRVRLGNLS